MKVLVVAEHSAGLLSPMSVETIAAAQQQPATVEAAVLGGSEAAQQMAGYALERVYSVEHELLEYYTPDGYSLSLQQLVAHTQPDLVLLPHTYQVRDFAPKLATALARVLIGDTVAIRSEPTGLVLTRQIFQGKLNVDVRFTGTPPCFASLQAGAWRASDARPGQAAVEPFRPTLEAAQIRTKPGERFRETARAVDLSAAPLIVSVGRGIGEAQNLSLVEQLAEALGAELAASRPICDNGWLPMERQVGSSGQTVAPKAYFAIGISGAIQHLVGMKGAKTVIAINRDPDAPIFEVADYGIAGDLFEVVPALTAAIRKLKS